jgi:hypothetical protein
MLVGKEELTKTFQKEVSDRSLEIDPNGEEDWYSLTIGWAIAKGLSVEDSLQFAVYIRYETSLG